MLPVVNTEPCEWYIYPGFGLRLSYTPDLLLFQERQECWMWLQQTKEVVLSDLWLLFRMTSEFVTFQSRRREGSSQVLRIDRTSSCILMN